MGWIAIDRNGNRWFPYIMADDNGKQDVLLHPELADTDMADLFMRELVSMLGPVTINPIEESR
jgi:hypothetical protein